MTGKRGRPRVDDETITEIRRLYHVEKLPMRKIAAMTGRSYGVVHKYASSEGSAPVRPRGPIRGCTRPPDDETIAEIRRLHYVEKMPLSRIRGKVGRRFRTVVKYLREGKPRRICRVCGRNIRVRRNGQLWIHGKRMDGSVCPGS